MRDVTMVGRAVAICVDSGSAVELHLSVDPAGGAPPGGTRGGGDLERQARSIYDSLGKALQSHGMTPDDVITEKIFLPRDDPGALSVDRIQREFYGVGKDGEIPPVPARADLPPAAPGQRCALQALAMRGAGGRSLTRRVIGGLPAGAAGRIVDTPGLRQAFLAGLTGDPAAAARGAGAEAASMFEHAAAALAREGLSFREVVRTWIQIADIDRDYAAFNSARRDFFGTQGVLPPPASTGVGGRSFTPGRAFTLDAWAITGAACRRVVAFRIPAINEAASYGSDFSRGVRADLEDTTRILISGTASIDADGRVVHPADVDGQVEVMLANVEGLLASQGSGWGEVVSAVTYLKEASFHGVFLRQAARRGLPSRLPNIVCVTDICRPEWLCEMEVTVVRARG